MLQHNHHSHPRSTVIHIIIENSHRHHLKNLKILLSNDYVCTTCSQGNLLVRTSFSKVVLNLHYFYKEFSEIYMDLFIHLVVYFVILCSCLKHLYDVHIFVYYLSTCNVEFLRLLTQVIRLRAQFSDYPIKTLQLNNTVEFTSITFVDLCISIVIHVEYLIPHAHTQNGSTKSFIKYLQVIARTLLLYTQFLLLHKDMIF